MNRTIRYDKSLEYALLVMGYKMEHCFLRNNLVWKQRLIKSTNRRNLFTCQSAVNYRLNLCKANKVKKRAVLVLTLHKECDIVVLHRINRYSSAWFVCALQKKKNVREQRRWIVTVWRARPTLHSTSRKRVSAFGMFAVSRVVFFYCLFQLGEEK